MYCSINIADCYNSSRIRKSPVWIWKLFIKSINFVWTFGTRNTFKSFWWSSDWLIGSSLNFDDTYLPMQKFGGQQQKKFQVEIHSLSIRQKFCSSFPFRNTSKLLPVWKLLIEWMYHMLKLKYLHGFTFNKSIIFKYVQQNLPLDLGKSNNCSDYHLQT